MFGGEFLLFPVTLRLTASLSDFKAASQSTVGSMLSGSSPPTSPGQVAGSGADTPDTSADDFATEANDFMHFTGAEPPKPNSLFFLVVGTTGSGKSTFISTCARKKLKIGHDLQSCTENLSIVSFMHSDNVHNIYLIDTPGFDDTNRSDVEILTQVAHYLSVSYANSIYISGVILLHRISDNRFSGSSRRNITMFKELVGEMAYENVAIATTMWWNGEHEMNLKKEKELQDEHFSDILSSGGTLFRLTGGLEAVDSAGARDQAMDIIAHLMLKAKEGPVVLRIQNEMVDETLALNKTAAGKVVETAVEVSRKEFEAQLQEARKEIADALRNQDSAAARVAREIHRELDEKDQKIVREQEALQKSLIEMYAKEEARVKKRIDQMELQWKEAAQKKEQELREVEARLAELQRTTEAEVEARRREEEQRVQQIQQQLNQERHTHHPQRRQEETEEMTSWSAIDAKWKARMAEQALQADQYRRRETQRLAKAEDARGRQEKEVLRLKKEMVALRQSIATKEEATSKVKEGFKKSTLSGIISGLASGTATAAIPIILGGMFCSVM